MDWKLVLFVFCVVIGKSCGHQLRCYACSFSSSESDQSCLTITDTTNTVECPYTYCTILRQEFLDPTGVVASFTRGCESEPDFLNHEITDSTYRTFYRACTSDLCNIGHQLRCYACSFSSSESDQSCLTITDTTNTVECPYTYCTILRQEFLDPTGVVASFTRGCESEPDFLNHEITDSTYRTFYRACTSDLCNIGNGVQTIVGGALSPYPQYNGDNLLVPGTADGASQITKSVASMILCIVIMFV